VHSRNGKALRPLAVLTFGDIAELGAMVLRGRKAGEQHRQPAGLAAPLQAAPVREPPIRHGGSSAFVLGEARGLAIEAPPSPQL